jgi:hypothetical protein
MTEEERQMQRAARMGLKTAAKMGGKATPMAPLVMAVDVAPSAAEMAGEMWSESQKTRRKWKEAKGLKEKGKAAAKGFLKLQQAQLRGTTKMALAAASSSELAESMMRKNPKAPPEWLSHIPLREMSDLDLEYLFMEVRGELRRRGIRDMGRIARANGGLRETDLKVVFDPGNKQKGIDPKYRIHMKDVSTGRWSDTGKYTYSENRAHQLMARILEAYS